MRFFILFAACVSLIAAEKLPPQRLIDLARSSPGSQEFRDALLASVPETDLKQGTAVVEYGPDFLWPVESDSTPALLVDEAPWPERMQKVGGEGPAIWIQTGKLPTGASHSFRYLIGAMSLGGRTDVPAYEDDC